MKNILSLCLLWICATHAVADDKGLWKCSLPDGISVIYVKEPVKDKKCKLISKVFSDIEITKFQKSLKRGDMSDKGLIVEVKPPLAKVQEKDAERWHRISDLSPSVE
jgi:hypothetical protein